MTTASTTHAIRSIHPHLSLSSSSKGNYYELKQTDFKRNNDGTMTSSSSSSLFVVGLRATNTISSFLEIPRGGTSETTTTIQTMTANNEDEENQVDEDDEDGDDDDDDDDETHNKSKITSSAPVNIQIKTSMNNRVVDIQTIEVTALRVRNIESIKSTLSRQLPGKPPVESIRLMYQGQILRDELLIDELMDDDDDDVEDDDEDEDEDDENKPGLTLVLDMVPPVDPRTFSGPLQENIDALSTADLLDAYALNEAAIWYNSQSLPSTAAATSSNEDEESDTTATQPTSSTVDESLPLIGFQIKQYANMLKSQLEGNVLLETAAPLLEDPIPPAQKAAELAKKPQVRGYRTRPAAAASAGGGGGGVQASSSVIGLKQTAQHYLNIVSIVTDCTALFVISC